MDVETLTGAAYRFAAKSQSRNSKFHGATPRFWEYGNHPEEIFSEKFFWTKLNRAAFRYIHMNHVRSGIVTKASEYVYSSASNYVRNEGIIDVCIASIPIIDFTWKNSLIEINKWQNGCFTAVKDRNTLVRRQ